MYVKGRSIKELYATSVKIFDMPNDRHEEYPGAIYNLLSLGNITECLVCRICFIPLDSEETSCIHAALAHQDRLDDPTTLVNENLE